MWLDTETFKCIIKYAPLVSIDLIVKNSKRQILVGKRRNHPAKEYFFIPGGRILKGETISSAFERITLFELGKKFTISDSVFKGVFEHFYDNSFFGSDISTHYIVLAYSLVGIDRLELPLLQHTEYLWLSVDELLRREDVHPYTKSYFRR